MEYGRVIYSSGGNYRVLFKDRVYDAKPRGIFRKNSFEIIVGDIVEINITENSNELNTIEKVIERKNKFSRPKIANVDYAIIVASIIEPKLDTLLIDKFITIFQSYNIEPILIFTKDDLSSPEIEFIDEYRRANYKIILSNHDDINILEKWIANSFSVITGQTGVGKSTFLNKLNDKFMLKTQEISKSLGRGKHTTRHSEAFEIFKNTYIVDTPGFSSLELEEIDHELLSKNFFNFSDLSKYCKFNDCKHINEIGCNVKKNTSENKYKNYIKIYEEIKNRKVIY